MNESGQSLNEEVVTYLNYQLDICQVGLGKNMKDLNQRVLCSERDPNPVYNQMH
jgi:hypothetical protein